MYFLTATIGFECLYDIICVLLLIIIDWCYVEYYVIKHFLKSQRYSLKKYINQSKLTKKQELKQLTNYQNGWRSN